MNELSEPTIFNTEYYKDMQDLCKRLSEASSAMQIPAGASLMEIPKIWPGSVEAEASGSIKGTFTKMG